MYVEYSLPHETSMIYKYDAHHDKTSYTYLQMKHWCHAASKHSGSYLEEPINTMCDTQQCIININKGTN